MKTLKLDKKKFRIRNHLKKVAKNNRFRLSIFRSSKNFSAQIIDDLKKITLLSASSVEKDIKNKNKINKIELSKIVAEKLAKKAQASKLTLAEMQGGCFTISSLGGIGGTAFTPIVNWPEVAILGLSRSQMKPIYLQEEFVPRLMLPMSLSYDHRVIDGAQAARFTRYLADQISDIRRLLL